MVWFKCKVGKYFMILWFWNSHNDSPNCWQKMVQYASRKFLPFGPTHLVFWRCIWHSMHQSLITALWMLHSYCMLCNCAWTFASFDLFSSGCTTIAHVHYCACEYLHHHYRQITTKLSKSNKASLKLWNLGNYKKRSKCHSG